MASFEMGIWCRPVPALTRDRETDEQVAPADPVGEPGTSYVAEKAADDEKRQITGRADHRQAAFGAQESRQPGRDGVVAALGAGAEQGGEQRRLQDARGEDLPEAGRLSRLASSALAETSGSST